LKLQICRHDIVYGGRKATDNAVARALKRTLDTDFAYVGFTFSTIWTQHWLHCPKLMHYVCACRRGALVQPAVFEITPFQYDFTSVRETEDWPAVRRASSDSFNMLEIRNKLRKNNA
jgi:hypothetical protein